MIKRKLKLCKGPCAEMVLYWAKGMCLPCYRLSNKPSGYARKPIAKLSAKRKLETAEYLKLRLDYLNLHPVCEVALLGCSRYATEIHHTYSGKDRQQHFLHVDTWKAICRFCHSWIHQFPIEARRLGLLK